MAASSQCSSSSGGASAGGDCKLMELCSSNYLALFDSDSDISHMFDLVGGRFHQLQVNLLHCGYVSFHIVQELDYYGSSRQTEVFQATIQ